MSYNRKIWRTGDVITEDALNNMERGIEDAHQNLGGTSGGTGGESYDDTEIRTEINNIKADLGTAQLTTTAKNIKGAINEIKNLVNQGGTGGGTSYDDTEIKADIQTLKDNQIILVEDETSMEGINDNEYPTLNTQDKTLIGSINEVNTQCADLANRIENVDTSRIPTSTSIESNKLYLKNSAGQKIDSGTVLPTGSSGSIDTSILAVSTIIESNRLYLRNSAGQKIDNGTLLPTSSSGDSSGGSSGSSDTLSEAQRNIIINEILDGVVPKYKTKAQYDVLTDDQKNDSSIEYHITDVEGVILTSPNGTQFKLKVANDGTLSTEIL